MGNSRVAHLADIDPKHEREGQGRRGTDARSTYSSPAYTHTCMGPHCNVAAGDALAVRQILRLCVGDAAFELLRLPGPPEELDERQRERFVAYTDADIVVFSKPGDDRAWTRPVLYYFTTSIKRVNALLELTEEAALVLT